MDKKKCINKRIKKSYAIISSLIILFSFFIVSCAKDGAIQKGEKYELNLAHFFPADHPVETDLILPWAEEIKEKTGGRVVINSYHEGKLLQAPAIYEGVVNGDADIGLSCFSYTKDRFPALEVFELPGIVYNTSRAASETAWEAIKELKPEEIKDTKLLMVIATGPGCLLTKKPVKNLNDLQGLKIRATEFNSKTLEALGATPVVMSQPEAYEALLRDVVEGNLSPAEVLKTWKHAEITNYITHTPFLYNNLFFITMNIDKWDSLPKDIQAIIEEVSEKYYRGVGISLWDVENEKTFNWIAEETNIEVIDLSDEEKDKWIEIVKNLQKEYINTLNDMGIDGQKILDTVKEYAKNYDEIY